MSDSTRTCKFSNVFEKEILAEIVPRRQAARDYEGRAEPNRELEGLSAAPNDAERMKRARPIWQSLVGIALSGGGIRAASFGLGVLQSLYQKRVLGRVDYLSSVSGGGYVASLFSGLVTHDDGKEIWKRHQFGRIPNPDNQTYTQKESLYTIAPGEGGKQPLLVRNLSTSGPLLKRPATFASAYFFGLFLTNLVAMSGLLAAGAFLAFLFQLLNEPSVSTFVGLLGFNDDVKQAFFPAFVLLVFWTICMVLGNAVQALEPLLGAARALFLMMVAAAAMAVVTLIGSGNIDLSQLGSWFGVSVDNRLLPTSGGGKIISLVVLLIALLPYLRVKELVRSGVQPRNFRDRWIFSIASWALLFGVPLLIFGYFVSEDYSRFNERREIEIGDYKFSKSNLLYPSFFGSNWEKFWRSAETTAKANSGPPAHRIAAERILPPLLATAAAPAAGPLPMPLPLVIASNAQEPQPPGVSPLVALRRETDRALWDIANGLPSGSPEGLTGARSKALSSPAALPAPKVVSTWPTDRRDVDEAQRALGGRPRVNPQSPADSSESPSRRRDDASIIDLLQEEQASQTEYDNRSWLEKLLLLSTVAWADGNPLAQQYEERLTNRERTNAICDRLNYQFLANPHVAAELRDRLQNLLNDPDALGPATKLTADQQQTVRETLTVLERSPAGAIVNWIDREKVEPSPANAVGPAAFYGNFLRWQPLKYQLLHHERAGWPEEQAQAAQLEQLEDHLQSQSGKKPRHRQLDYEAIEDGIRAFNMAALDKIIYNDTFQPQNTVFASVVLRPDQRARLRFAGWAALTCLVTSLLVNLNFSSIHSYYQQLLTKIWIPERPNGTHQISLVDLDTTEVGAPYHLLHGAVTLKPRGRWRPDFPRGGFLFSRRYCGGVEMDYLPTGEFRGLELATAMSVSGAAVTPAAVDNRLVWVIMFLCNMRTGQYLAWPSKVVRSVTELLYRFATWLPGMAWHVALNACVPGSWRTTTFVYDGGLYENLGVEPLLARRCRLVFAVDASEDSEAQFADFQLLVQRCRSRYGIKIEALRPANSSDASSADDPSSWMAALSPEWTMAETKEGAKRTMKSRFAKQSVMVFRLTYPQTSGLRLPELDENKREGILVYLKPALTRAADADIRGYASAESAFPQDETLNQFYTPRQFDAYRSLGMTTGDEALELLVELLDRKLPGMEPIEDILQLLEQELKERAADQPPPEVGGPQEQVPPEGQEPDADDAAPRRGRRRKDGV